jgi:carbon starvation protein
MIDKESDIRPIGYGAMLMEGLVGIMALIAAASMHPGDYFAINTPPAVFQTLGHDVVDLPAIEQAVGEQVEGRTGGAVTLAIGMAQIFAGLPGMSGMVDYWYHFAIMFEALFILTVIDAGTRVGRFLVGEFIGRVHKPFASPHWMPGAMISTLLVVAAWGYFIWTGNISTIWPMFGIANQLLASVALAVGTTILINMGRSRYAWVTLVPMTFLSISTLTAGFLSVRDNFWPMATGANEALRFQGIMNSTLTVFMMVLVVIVLGAAIMKWLAVGRSGVDPDLAVSRTA